MSKKQGRLAGRGETQPPHVLLSPGFYPGMLVLNPLM